MKKVVILIFIFINLLYSLDLNNFEERQKVLQDVRTIILYEEFIARAYEEHILTNYDIPNFENITSQIGDISLTYTDIYKTHTLGNGLTNISYGLSDELKDSSIKALYESNTYRERTYFRDNKINFILEDDFAKHLYDLIKQNGGAISDCPNTEGDVSKQNCKLDNHIYIGVTKIKKETKNIDGEESDIYIPNEYLMAYHINKFKTGPIIITDDTSKHITENEFDSIPKGALLYDVNGVKYIKTVDKIEVLK